MPAIDVCRMHLTYKWQIADRVNEDIKINASTQLHKFIMPSRFSAFRSLNKNDNVDFKNSNG